MERITRKAIRTYDPKKKKMVFAGTLIDGVFLKKVTAKHFMKVEQGYGIQEDVIQILKELGCETVMISAPKKHFEIPFHEYLAAPSKNYGNGNQRFVSVSKKTRNQTMIF